jgi:hypothetical protein
MSWRDGGVWFVVTVLAGCTPVRDRATDATAPDAASPDATGCPDDVVYQPIALTGSTPAGPLEAYHYVHARYAGAWCGESYQVEFTPTMARDNCTSDAFLVLGFGFPAGSEQMQTGELAGYADVTSWPNTLANTGQITFEVERVDPPLGPTPHVVGRFVSRARGWSIDLPVDLVSQFGYACQ